MNARAAHVKQRLVTDDLVLKVFGNILELVHRTAQSGRGTGAAPAGQELEVRAVGTDLNIVSPPLIFISHASVGGRTADDIRCRTVERPGRPGDRIGHTLLGRPVYAQFSIQGLI